MAYNVLIVEDNFISAKYLQLIIQSCKSFKVLAITQDIKSSKKILKEKKIDLVFIDMKLKNGDYGGKLALDIAKNYPNIIIAIATAYHDKKMLEDAADANAFCYHLKPYRPEEIRASLELIKERIEKKVLKNRILYLIDGYYFDFVNERLCKNNKEVPLSKEELSLIKLLAKNHNITLSKETILNYLNISNEALRALIYRIRHITSKHLIKNYKRFGYKISTI